MRGAALQLNFGAGAANGPSCGTSSTSAPPAIAADAANSRRPDQRSESVSSADTSAPATKPICTEIVSQEAPAEPSRHTVESVGATAEALNHGAMPHSSAAASTASTRRAL